MQPELTPSRLRLARHRRGLTAAALADLIGTTARTIRNYEAGDRIPDEPTLDRLALALGVPVGQLTAPDAEPVPADAVSFRARSKTTMADRNRALASIPDAEALTAWLGQRYRLPTVDVPDLSDIADPEAAAGALRAAWGLGTAPAPDIINLLEHHGVRCFSLGRDFDDVDAFSLWRNGEPYVFFSTTKSGERGRMDGGHELGHLCRHRHHPTDRDDETDANRFASAFLMPADDVLATVRAGATVADILHHKRRWGVAAVALAYRLHDLELLTDWQYRSVIVQLSRMGYRSSEPGGIQNETSEFLKVHLDDARQRHGIGAAGLAAELQIAPADLRKLVFDQAIISIEGDGRRSASRANLRAL